MKTERQERDDRVSLKHLRGFVSTVGPEVPLCEEVISEVCENLEELAIRRDSAPIYRSFTRDHDGLHDGEDH